MEDDPREIDWPQRQVKRIDAQLEKLRVAYSNFTVATMMGTGPENRVNTAHRRISERERQLQTKDADPSLYDQSQIKLAHRRISELERELKKMASDWSARLALVAEETSFRISGLSESLNGTDQGVVHLRDRLDQADARITENAQAIDQVSEELAGTDQDVLGLNDRISKLEVALHNYGIPTVAPYSEFKRSLNGQPIETVDFSEPIGQDSEKNELDEAAHRVQEYMQRNHFSYGTTAAVIRAIRGV